MPGRKNKQSSKGTEQRNRVAIDPDIIRRIVSEAEVVNLSVSDYLAMLVHSAEMIRKTLLPSGGGDASVIKKLLGNPILLEVIKSMGGSFLSDALKGTNLNLFSQGEEKQEQPKSNPQPQYGPPVQPQITLPQMRPGYRPPVHQPQYVQPTQPQFTLPPYRPGYGEPVQPPSHQPTLQQPTTPRNTQVEQYPYTGVPHPGAHQQPSLPDQQRRSNVPTTKEPVEGTEQS